MPTPNVVLIPIYATDADPWGFCFERSPGDEPAAWYWVPAGFSFEVDPGSGRQVIREPGRESLRYAHEAYWSSIRGQDLPDFAGPQLDD